MSDKDREVLLHNGYAGPVLYSVKDIDNPVVVSLFCLSGATPVYIHSKHVVTPRYT